MKILSDGTEVSDRSYHYLLDFNDATDNDFIKSEFNKESLTELDFLEYQILFEIATYCEFADSQHKLVVINERREKYRAGLSEDFLPIPKQKFPYIGHIGHIDFFNGMAEIASVKQLENEVAQLKSKQSLILSETPNYFLGKPKKRPRSENNKKFKASIRNIRNQQ